MHCNESDNYLHSVSSNLTVSNFSISSLLSNQLSNKSNNNKCYDKHLSSHIYARWHKMPSAIKLSTPPLKVKSINIKKPVLLKESFLFLKKKRTHKLVIFLKIIYWCLWQVISFIYWWILFSSAALFNSHVTEAQAYHIPQIKHISSTLKT